MVIQIKNAVCTKSFDITSLTILLDELNNIGFESNETILE